MDDRESRRTVRRMYSWAIGWMYGRTDRRTEGWTDEQMGGLTNGGVTFRLGGWTDERMDGRMERQMDRLMDGSLGERTIERMADGWMNGQASGRTER